MEVYFSTSEIVGTLINQVRNAVPAGGSERDVITVISRPFWRLWLLSVGFEGNEEPTAWIGMDTIRVWGSETHVIESVHYFSASRAKDYFKNKNNQ